MINTIIFIFEIFTLFIFPLFIRLKIRDINYKQIIATVLIIFSIFFLHIYIFQYHTKYLGIENIKNGFIYYLILSINVVLILLLLSKFVKDKAFKLPFNKPKVNILNIIYLTLSAFVQEFMYRTFIFESTSYLNKPIFIALIFSTILFGWLHIYFLDNKFIFSATVFGFLISIIYYNYPNLYLATFVHTIVGILMNYNYKYIPIQKYSQKVV
jgi:membrane protease YdiL (CAAX protease family)